MHAAMMRPLAVHHRGFSLAVQTSTDGFAFAVSHEGLTLHASTPAYQTATSADRAGRRFIDDALGAFSYATQTLAA